MTGRWYYNSGSWHADWDVLGIPITDENGGMVDQGLALLPRADLNLEETWFVASMRSSGSNCLSANDVWQNGKSASTPVTFLSGPVALARLGMPLIDSAEVNTLTVTCAELGCHSFLFTCGAMPTHGATGVPVNPLAIL